MQPSAIGVVVSDSGPLIARLCADQGRHYEEAKLQLERGLLADPRDMGMANALVRMLSAAPRGSIRDGARAKALARPLFEATKSPEVEESYAMALAEAGEFEAALGLQQDAARAFEQMQRPHARKLAERNLDLYRAHKPARELWASDDVVFQPRSPAVTRAGG